MIYIQPDNKMYKIYIQPDNKMSITYVKSDSKKEGAKLMILNTKNILFNKVIYSYTKY